MAKIKIAVTGGPSGGKTTLIDALQKDLGSSLSVVAEAASLLYRGGFPRKPTTLHKYRGQRAICLIQRELESLAEEVSQNLVLVCDRGSLDSVAYWPDGVEDFFQSLQTTRDAELARYQWVIHLDTADIEHFDTTNPVRTESHLEALDLNAKIKVAWQGHPQRLIIPHADDFLHKIGKAKAAVQMIAKGSSFEEIRLALLLFP